MKFIYPALIMLAVAYGGAQTAGAGAPANSNLINLVVVGYDIEKNPKAQTMVREMAQAARDSGAVGEIIMSGQDQAQLDQAMQQAMTIATQPVAPPSAPPPASVTLTLKAATVKPGARIVVEHSPLAGADKAAWIGFYKGKETASENYLEYTFLNNLTDCQYDVIAPEEPGLYHFRIFPDKGYTPAAISAEVEVK